MHACLALPDIFERILEFVVLVPRSNDPYAGHHQFRTSNPILAALARTCHAFLEPTLDILWRTQITLGPLVQTLPEDTWKEVIDEQPHPYGTIHNLTLRRPLLQSDWVRFDYYASRIRSLGYYMTEFADNEQIAWAVHCDYCCRRPIEEVLLRQLCIYRRQQYLLPNLTRLRWTNYDIFYLDYMPMFFGPRLTTLSIAFYERAIEETPTLPDALYDELPRILAALHRLCPSLKDLEMWPEQIPEAIASTVPFALACKQLSGYTICDSEPPKSRELLIHLSQQESLRKTYLSFGEEDADDMSFLTNHPSARPNLFRALDTLALRTPSLFQSTTFIKLLGSCRLRLVIIEFLEPADSADLLELFIAFRDHCSANTLQSFAVEHLYWHKRKEPLIPEVHGLSMDILFPMLGFNCLRTFKLNVPLMGLLMDEDLRDMADAWPLLVEFRPIWRCQWGVAPSRITWAGVAYLAWRCPQLIEMDIGIDTTIQNVEETTNLPGFKPNRSLRMLEIMDSVLCEPELCARAIFAFAPLMADVSGQEVKAVDDKGDILGFRDYTEGYFYEVTDHVVLLRQIADHEIDPQSPTALAVREVEELNPWGWHGS